MSGNSTFFESDFGVLYYNIYSKEPAAKVTIYTSILYFVIVIYESMVDVFLTIRLLIF